MNLITPDLFIWMLTVCALVVLLFYNSVIYFYSRLKSFLYYSAYNFFLLIYVGSKTGLYSLFVVTQSVHHDNWIIQVIYNLAYLQFFRYFLDLKKNDIPLDNLLKKFFNIALILSFAVNLVLFIMGKLILFYFYFLYLFLPAILIIAIYSIYKALQLKDNIKYYIIFGVSIYIILGVFALYLTEHDALFFGLEPITAFYIGILLETILFSMGLGHKIRNIANERMTAKQMLIEQLQVNDKIKESANKNLENEVASKTKELIMALEEREQDKIARLQLEYEQKIMELNLVSLRNQMNPHFIFNALNAIKSAIISDHKMDAVTYLNKFSKLLREILRRPDNGVYTLQQELNTLELYLNLENIRLQDKVEFHFDVAKEINTHSVKIPPLLLQPLAENAIWHGLSGVSGYTKKILIQVFKEENEKSITIHVEDNGIGLNKARLIKEQKIYLRDSLGIKLVRDRLMLFSQQRDAEYSLTYIDLEDENPKKNGTRVVIKLPY